MIYDCQNEVAVNLFFLLVPTIIRNFAGVKLPHCDSHITI